MLWESTDAPSALRDRFGFDSLEDAGRWLTETLATTWAMETFGCERIVISDHNAIAWVHTDQGAFVAKWSRAKDRFSKFAAIAELIDALGRRGLPVAAPLASVDGRRSVIVRPGSAPLSMTVQPRMPGKHLDTYDGGGVHAAGACLASLHRAMAEDRDTVLISSARLPALDLHARIQTWLDVEDARIVPTASERLRSQLTAVEAIDTEPQLVHNNYRAANILARDSRITAVLDFDDIAWDHRVCDIAHACVYLTTLFTNWRPTPPCTRQTFLDGYQSVRSLTGPEQDWLEVLVLWDGIRAIPGGPDRAAWASAL